MYSFLWLQVHRPTCSAADNAAITDLLQQSYKKVRATMAQNAPGMPLDMMLGTLPMQGGELVGCALHFILTSGRLVFRIMSAHERAAQCSSQPASRPLCRQLACIVHATRSQAVALLQISHSRALAGAAQARRLHS